MWRANNRTLAFLSGTCPFFTIGYFFFLPPLPAPPFLAGLWGRLLSAEGGFFPASLFSLPAPPSALLLPALSAAAAAFPPFPAAFFFSLLVPLSAAVPFSDDFFVPFPIADLLLDFDLLPPPLPLSAPPPPLPLVLGRPLSPFFFLPPLAASSCSAAASASARAIFFLSASTISKARDSRSACERTWREGVQQKLHVHRRRNGYSKPVGKRTDSDIVVRHASYPTNARLNRKKANHRLQ